MTQQEVLNHLNARIGNSLTLGGGGAGGIFTGGIGQKILDALRELVGTAGLDVETVVAAALKYYDDFVRPDNPSIPNFWESIVESLGRIALERAIRRLFATQLP